MLKIDNIRVTVENKDIVKGVSLTIKPGEIHALMGPNGSGKSSLAMALAGHPHYVIACPPVASPPPARNASRSEAGGGDGRRARSPARRVAGDAAISLDGVNISDKTPDERARMGLFLASQYPVGVEGVTVEQLLRRTKQELISLAPAVRSPLPWSPSTRPLRRSSRLDSARLVGEASRGVATAGFGRTNKFLQSKNMGPSEKKIDVLEFRKDLEALAEKVGVNRELLFRSINVGFSGGEKKRLEVLQMLVLQPKYAILDETDSGLDIDALKKVAGMVKMAEWPDGYKPGILVITHYARLLTHLQPDYVHIMKSGEIVESGGKEVAERIEKKGYK